MAETGVQRSVSMVPSALAEEGIGKEIAHEDTDREDDQRAARDDRGISTGARGYTDARHDREPDGKYERGDDDRFRRAISSRGRR